MLDNGISLSELDSSNYQSMLTVPDVFLTQEGIKDTYQKVEKDLEEVLRKKGINVPKSVNSNPISNNPNIEKEIQSQQSQLRSQITSLEQKPNKTPAEQAELEEKRKRLQELLKKQNDNANNTTKPSDKTALVVGGVIGILFIFGLFILARTRRKRPVRA